MHTPIDRHRLHHHCHQILAAIETIYPGVQTQEVPVLLGLVVLKTALEQKMKEGALRQLATFHKMHLDTFEVVPPEPPAKTPWDRPDPQP